MITKPSFLKDINTINANASKSNENTSSAPRPSGITKPSILNGSYKPTQQQTTDASSKRVYSGTQPGSKGFKSSVAPKQGESFPVEWGNFSNITVHLKGQSGMFRIAYVIEKALRSISSAFKNGCVAVDIKMSITVIHPSEKIMWRRLTVEKDDTSEDIRIMPPEKKLREKPLEEFLKEFVEQDTDNEEKTQQ